MLIKHACIENSSEHFDIRISKGCFEQIATHLDAYEGEEILDLKGALLMSPFVESHIHLDSALSAGKPRYNRSGTLFEGIEIWSERKAMLDKEALKKEAISALKLMSQHGVQFVRSHVDCTDPTLLAAEALLEVKDEVKDYIELQLVAFPQEGILSFPKGKELVEQALKLGLDAVGAIPHYEYTREYSVESLNYIFELAQKYDCLIDVHCDEIDDEASRGLETLACRALETGLKERVTASHTTAMHSYNNAYCSKLFRLLKRSEINFIANPLVNIHLQGRFDSYPKRRGMTRAKELLAAGINLAFGHDDIQDPWYPLGMGNPMDVCHMGLHVGQLLGYEQIMDSYKLVSHNAARCLNIQDHYGIAEGKTANFIVLNASNWYEALNKRAEVLYSFREGRLIFSCTPKEITQLW